MEIWDTYDKNRVKTETKMIRGADFDNGQLHLIVHLCLFNSDGQMLIQQRQADKIGWANKWDLTVGGSALSGETSQSAVQRELLEELGLTINFKDTRPHLTVNYEHGFDDFYLLSKDVLEEELSLQKEEVQAAKWATKEEILIMINEGSFIPYFSKFIELLFDSRDQYGMISRKHSMS